MILNVYVHNCYKTYDSIVIYVSIYVFYRHYEKKREKNRFTLDEATQFVLDLSSDSEKLDFDDLFVVCKILDLEIRSTDVHVDSNITAT